jgi:hypothetical protein
VIREKGLRKYTPNTITEPETLKEHLKSIRRLGYATSDQEIYTGVKALAAPIFDYSGRVVASICVAGPRERFTQEKFTLLLDYVKRAAHSITAKLGGKEDKLIVKDLRPEPAHLPGQNWPRPGEVAFHHSANEDIGDRKGE